MERRTFLKASSGAALWGAAALTGVAAGQGNLKEARKMIWANLVHLSYNMWCDWSNPKNETPYTNYDPGLRFDEGLWQEITKEMAAAGMNMVVLDLGDGVVYESHPEIAVKNAWSTEKLKTGLAKLRALGLEPIPKLNFSCGHDAWLGPYSRCVSTPRYYEVCADLIKEVMALFERPRFFHLGMDEEDFHNQARYEYALVRQHGLWWHDFLFLGGASREGWRAGLDLVRLLLEQQRRSFSSGMPKSVVQSNWYYGTDFGEKAPNAVLAYRELAEAGYDQIPTGSNWSSPESFGLTVEHCTKVIPQERLLGFFQTPWKPTLSECRQHHLDAIAQVRKARQAT